jgi:Pyruvate dehydrogenase complex, dehydrogenase (E1) component
MTENSNVAPHIDADPQETKEWLESLAAVVEKEGPARAHYLIETLIATARQEG